MFLRNYDLLLSIYKMANVCLSILNKNACKVIYINYITSYYFYGTEFWSTPTYICLYVCVSVVLRVCMCVFEFTPVSSFPPPCEPWIHESSIVFSLLHLLRSSASSAQEIHGSRLESWSHNDPPPSAHLPSAVPPAAASPPSRAVAVAAGVAVHSDGNSIGGPWNGYCCCCCCWGDTTVCALDSHEIPPVSWWLHFPRTAKMTLILESSDICTWSRAANWSRTNVRMSYMSWVYNAIEHRRENPFNELFFSLLELGEQLSELTLARAINVLTEYITELAAVHREFSFNFSIQKTKAPLSDATSQAPRPSLPAQARPPTHSAFMLSHILTVLWGGIVFVSFIFVYNVHTHTHTGTHTRVCVHMSSWTWVCVRVNLRIYIYVSASVWN